MLSKRAQGHNQHPPSRPRTYISTTSTSTLGVALDGRVSMFQDYTTVYDRQCAKHHMSVDDL